MSFWSSVGFLFWFLLSSILLGASVWSTRILMNQKKAWRGYAKRNGLTYTGGPFLGSPTVDGYIGDYRVSLFTAERQAPDVRNRRFVTAIEIQMPKGVVDSLAAGTSDMITFIESLSLLHRYKPKSIKWPNAYIVHVSDDDIIDAYLTRERATALNRILRIKNADVLVIFNSDEGVVRLETPDPMQNAARMDKIIRGIISNLDTLLLRDGELEEIMANAGSPSKKDSSVQKNNRTSENIRLEDSDTTELMLEEEEATEEPKLVLEEDEDGDEEGEEGVKKEGNDKENVDVSGDEKGQSTT